MDKQMKRLEKILVKTQLKDFQHLQIDIYTANIYSRFTVIGCVTCATVIWQWWSQTTTVHITFTDIEEYNMRSIAILDCNIHSQITVAHVTLPKAVPSTVEIFAVYKRAKRGSLKP